FGNGQFELGVLVEPLSGMTSSKDAFVDSVWQQLQRSNDSMDSHARILTKNAILVKPDRKQIPLTDKGSVQRKQVYATFDAEIATVYSQLLLNNDDAAVTSFNSENPKITVRELAQRCLPPHVEPGSWADDRDFVSMGMDSLQMTKFRRLLCASLRKSGPAVPAENSLPRDIIYFHPSVSALSAALTKWLNGSISETDPTAKMASFVDKYAYRSEWTIPEYNNAVVLLTGSTGNLGANILYLLSCNPRVHSVVCLIRSVFGQEEVSSKQDLVNRQWKALQSRGIVISTDGWLKIEFLPWAPGHDRLGLSDVDYQTLASRVTHIFHGAWPMDFKMKLQSLEPHIKA
ncbi:MAG: hypothetical protein Q9187_009689, partial [Circinaria calcarea]